MQPTATSQPDLLPRVPASPSYAFELARAARRREDMRIARPVGHADAQWALGLSGGGIRSATFCLGTMQGLEKSHVPIVPEPSATPDPAPISMLRQFDYLSTVSGGGYIGGFFSSLFVPGRLEGTAGVVQSVPDSTGANAALSDQQVADRAYRVFTENPPTRLRHDEYYDPDHPGRLALAWLRENGRYLIPSGAGDMVYAIAIHIRNWCATHYVLGTVFLIVFALLAAIRSLAIHFGIPELGTASPDLLAQYATHEADALRAAIATVKLTLGLSSIWWSPWWWLLLPIIVLWLVPSGLSFWLTHPRAGRSVADSAERWSRAWVVCVGVGVVLGAIAYAIWRNFEAWRALATALGAGSVFSVLGAIWFWFTADPTQSIAGQRVVLTRGLSNGIMCAALVATVAFLDTCAQTLYVQGENIWSMLSPAMAATAMVWVARQISNMTTERKAPSWISRIPLNVIAGVAGTILACLVAVMWALAVLWIQWRGTMPNVAAFASQTDHLPYLYAVLLAVVLAFILAVATGGFPGFLNLSTLQGLYSARITRAYLGASNSRRFAPGNTVLRSVAEPAKGDHMELEDLYRNPYAPMHIINTCMNLTSDPTEQLVQRDRKAKPLAVIPGGLSYDNETHPMPAREGTTEVSAPLTVGEWIGVSGAAFTTGLGRSTSLGFSLLLGLANVRLGRWWPTRIVDGTLLLSDKGWRAMFKTQIYLIDEILGRFYGIRREWQYLSDGGHFENTAAYELLRPERNIKLIVICDCGADPDYEFTDLANLTRLARIDFGIELEEDDTVAKLPALAGVFGRTTDFPPPKAGALPAHDKCAILLNVYRAKVGPKMKGVARGAPPEARIILLKPRLLSTSATDLCEYMALHPTFPQESTADQFFDEAQWESYRRLGLEIAARVFPGQNSTQEYCNAFAKILDF